MNKRRMYTIGLTVLLLGVMLTTYGVWTQSSFSHGDPSFDQGCYCHNNGIAVWVNDSGDGNGGLYLGSFTAGSTFHLLVSTNDAQATGVVPGLQLWESNQTDNAKFTISPTEVTATSTQNLNKTAGSITGLYQITAPTTPGTYTLTLYGQGTLLEPIMIQATGGTTSTTSSSTTSASSTSSTTSLTSSTKSSTTSTTSSASTKSTTSTTSSTSTTQSTASTTTTSSTPSTTGSIAFTSPSSGASLSGTQSYTISGTISPTPSLPDGVFIVVELQGSSTALDSSTQAVTASGTFSYTTSVGGSPSWVTGTYVIAAADSNGARGTMTFKYTPSGSTTSTTSSTTSTTSTTPTASTTSTSTTDTLTVTTTLPVTTTTTSTTTHTVTGPASTITSTVTQTTSTVPGWAYGVMVVLLILGLAMGYVIKNLIPNRPAIKGSR